MFSPFTFLCHFLDTASIVQIKIVDRGLFHIPSLSCPGSAPTLSLYSLLHPRIHMHTMFVTRTVKPDTVVQQPLSTEMLLTM